MSSESTLADSSLTFELEDEDHTLANALRWVLNQNPHVTFCGYSMPHPSQHVVNLRVQTSGEVSATDALREACSNLRSLCGALETKFVEAYDAYEEAQQLAGNRGGSQEGGGRERRSSRAGGERRRAERTEERQEEEEEEEEHMEEG